MHFQRLRNLREDMDMSQTKIARLLHTSHTVYSRYERGFRTIPVEHFLILANFYGVSVVNTNGIAHDLTDKFGSLSKVLSADEEKLRSINGIGAGGAVYAAADFFPK